ncbi:MAG: DUF6602 domain-containing protein [Bacteroidota bacterium]
MKKHLLMGIEKVSSLLDVEFSYAVAQHNFELGVPLENALKNWFVPYFPKRYAFGSGYMVDKNEKQSNQCDWIIFDPIHFNPLIHKAALTDNVEYYPFDSVYGCVEIKRTLSIKTLVKVINQLKEIRSLERENANLGYINPLLDYSGMSKLPLKDIITNRLITAIYAYTIDKHFPSDYVKFLEYINQNYAIDDLPDIIAVHGNFILFKTHRFVSEKGESIVNFSLNQSEMNSVSIKASGEITSGYFYVMLLSMLQNTILCAKDYTNTLYGIIKDVGSIATANGKS